MFQHTLTQRRKSTNQKKALQTAKKVVLQVEKIATQVSARTAKKARIDPAAIPNEDPIDDNPNELFFVREAKERLLSARKTIKGAKQTIARTTRVGKIQTGMSIKYGCQCCFVLK